MSPSLTILSFDPRCGKSLVALGVAQSMLRKIPELAFFRPAGTGASGADQVCALMRARFALDETAVAVGVDDVVRAMTETSAGHRGELHHDIIARFRELQRKADFVLCLGTDLETDITFETEFNLEVAANLGSPVLLVVRGRGRSAEEAAEGVILGLETLRNRGLQVVAVAVNRYTGGPGAEVLEHITSRVAENDRPPVFVIPEDDKLSRPSMAEVRDWLGADVLYGGERLGALVSEYLVAAMQPGNFLGYVSEGCLVVTPGDRTDIILASLAAQYTSAFPSVAGMVLTGNLRPTPNLTKMLDGWPKLPMAMLLAPEHSYKTMQRLATLYPRIRANDTVKIETALRVFEASVDQEALTGRLATAVTDRMTPRMFEFTLLERAKAARRRIVLAEGHEERILRATEILLARDIAEIILIGDAALINQKANACGLDIRRAEIVSPTGSPDFDDYAATLYALRKDKGLTLDAARDLMADKTYFASMMVYKGRAHGMVSGATTTTAETIRPALQFIRTRPGFSIVSSVFFMCLPDRVLVYGDCAVNPDPNAEELAQIAIASAGTARAFGVEPRVAMLSYSTGASGKGPDVDLVRQATSLVRERAPDLPVEGPIQYDAAIDPVTAKEKLPDSDVAGRATVFIFPDLDTGNNTYKAVQRSSGAVAMGPVLQGLRKPVNDLSRGCLVKDIVFTVAITAIQAREDA